MGGKGETLTLNGLYVDVDAPMGDEGNVGEHLPGTVAGMMKKRWYVLRHNSLQMQSS